MKNYKAYRKLISYASMCVFMAVSIMFFSSYIPMKKVHHTEEKLFSISWNLYFEKEDVGEYPYDISCFKQYQFDGESILIDSWGNTFYYERFDNGQEYLLISKGKDGVLFTDDDILRSSKK